MLEKSGLINIYFFTGTGNTLSVVLRMADVLRSRGMEVKLHRMESVAPELVDTQHVVGLAFPVAVQGTYPFIWEFVKKMPEADGTPVFMVDTMSEYSGGIVGPMRKILERKGYMPIGAREIRMPPNIPLGSFDREKIKKRLEEGLKKAEKYAIDLMEGRTKWGRIPLLSDAMALISRSETSWKIMRKLLSWKVDMDKCVKCRLCVHLCPVSNIKWDGNKPVYGDSCYLCMRCYAFCPVDAIYSTSVIFSGQKYKAVRASDILKIKG